MARKPKALPDEAKPEKPGPKPGDRETLPDGRVKTHYSNGIFSIDN